MMGMPKFALEFQTTSVWLHFFKLTIHGTASVKVEAMTDCNDSLLEWL